MRWVGLAYLVGLVGCGAFGSEAENGSTDASTPVDGGTTIGDGGSTPGDGGETIDGGTPSSGFVQAKSADANGTQVNLPLDTPTADKALIMVVVASQAQSYVAKVMDSENNSYAPSTFVAAGVTCNHVVDVWYAAVAKPNVKTVSVVTSPGGPTSAWVIEARGFSTFDTAKPLVDGTAGGGSAKAPAITAFSNGPLFLLSAVIGCGTVAGLSSPSTYSNLKLSKFLTATQEGAAWRVVTKPDGDGAVFSTAPDIKFNALTIAFRP